MSATSKLQTLLTGLAFGESPRWHASRLWFSNWGAQEIVAVDLEGESEVALRLPFSSFPFSIDWLPDGRLLLVSASDQPLMCRESDGSLTTYVDVAGLVPRPNEIVVDGRGNTYLNGMLDLKVGDKSPPGIVALVAPDGSSRRVADGIVFPNGMVITPDNKTLIISDSFGNKLIAFDITSDGSLSNRRVWADLGDGAPDGICLDSEGAVWYGDVPNKRCVRVREGGEVLQTIELDRGCFACMLGGTDNKTLFMAAAEWHGFDKMIGAPRTGKLLTFDAPAPGAGWPATVPVSSNVAM